MHELKETDLPPQCAYVFSQQTHFADEHEGKKLGVRCQFL
jgi:hypothetical protein